MPKKKQKFDILLVPHNSAGKVKKVKFSYSLFKFFILLNFFILLILVLSLVYLFNKNLEINKINLKKDGNNETITKQILLKENQNLNSNLVFLRKRILKNFKKINNIEDYKNKIKSFISISDNSNIPQGGFLKKIDGKYNFNIDSYAFYNDFNLMVDLKSKSEINSLLLKDYENYISQNLDKLNNSIISVYGKVIEKSQMLLSTPSIWPVRGWLSSGFGIRNDPFNKTKKFHEGLDIANNPGMQIKATANGIVSFAGVNGGYGNVVMIDHLNNIQTRYAHLQSFIVKFGQHVQKGQVIGYLGNTGRSSGPHLHYEVRKNGIPVNPKLYIIE